MAEDRFANVFSGTVTMSAANTLTFAELVFGITLRDRIAIVIDELFFFWSVNLAAQMTTASDSLTIALSNSDSILDTANMDDRRILYSTTLQRWDFGTAGSAQLVVQPIKESFSPPMIILPNRLFLSCNTTGLAAAQAVSMRMHYRTVSITQDQQLIEVLETFQLST